MRYSRIWNRIKEKAKRRLTGVHGFTMAEMLIVVAIIAVLGGVSFIAVNRYQRSMGQLERDAIAKQIFVAAQNHLSATQNEKFTNYGTPGDFGEDANKKVFYYVVTRGVASGNGAQAFERMLPFGAIDETVRSGGSYLIRYQPEAGIVMDVFYCSTAGTPSQFNHTFFDGDSYGYVCARAGENNKAARRTYVKDSILGWYGGAEVETLEYKELDPPEIEVVNAERLYVRIKDPNLTNPDLTQGDLNMRLIVKGESSGKEHYLNIDRLNWTGEKEADGSLIVVLDDITNQTLHFCNRVYDDMKVTAPDTGNGFIPGENITVQAMVDGNVTADSKTVYVPAYSARRTANSLFASIADTDGDSEKVFDTASIANIRHLENLDAVVSNLRSSEKIAIRSAVQTDNLIWKDSDAGTKDYISEIRTQKNLSADPSVTGWSGGLTRAGYYLPVNLGTVTGYDGRAHSITGVIADGSFTGGAAKTNAGLFDTLTRCAVSNLQLLDFTVSGTNSAGALAGTAENTTVTNVLARNSGKTGAAVDVTATAGFAGGLIGSVTGGSVENCAAALIVNGSENAGGLIGTASGNVTVSRCYSGGHTKNGNYKDWVTANHLYDVTGETAGGLIGNAGSATVTNSYSTCSVSGTTAGGSAGGLIGSVTGGSITNCYCTGLVTGTTEGAFAGSLSGTDKEGITPLDSDLTSYNTFVGAESAWDPASPYDVNLRIYYKNKFPLQTVFQLEKDVKTLTSGKTEFVRTHFGDWPAPETFVINN